MLSVDKHCETARTRRKYPLARSLLFQPNLTYFCFSGMNHPSKDVDKDIFFSAGHRNILFKHNILCKVEFYERASGPFARWEATEGHATNLSIAYRRKSFRKMTLRFLVPSQIKLAIACCLSFVALVSCTRETVQLSSFPTFVRANGVTFFKFLFQTIPNKRGTRSKLSPLPTFNVDNQVICFSFLMEKTRYFPTLIRGDGGYVIQLKCTCPNYLWQGL